MAQRDWVSRAAFLEALTARVERDGHGYMMIRHERGAPALGRPRAVAEVIDRSLVRQLAVSLISPSFGHGAAER